MEDGLYGKSRRGCCFRFAAGSLVKGEGDRHEVVFEGTVKSYVTFVVQISHLQKGSVIATPGRVKKQANSVLLKDITNVLLRACKILLLILFANNA